MVDEKIICYFYGKESETFVAKLKESKKADGILFVPFAQNEVYPSSGETLYLGFNGKTITFKGEVVNTFNTVW